jgi:glucose-6-phosphate isomerase
MAKPIIRYEYRGALASVLGDSRNGITDAEWTALADETSAIVRRIEKQRAATPYRDVPRRQSLSQLGAVLKSAARKQGAYDDFVVLGIGGSALGLTCLKTALLPPYWNLLSKRKRGGRPRLWVMDNVDPAEFAAMMGCIDTRRTLFNIISKSGETAETVSQFLIALELVQECLGKDWKKHVVLTTDKKKGLLRPVVKAMGLESFIVPDGLGGRFSVMSPVGLFPAAMLGMDVKGLLEGARQMDLACKSTDFDANPAAQGAAVQIGLYRKGKPLSVMMPYAAALKDVADWYCQLWAESLGKIRKTRTAAGKEKLEYVGPTPIKALGVTDQHSQVQLYREGPADKVFTLLSVEDFGCTLPLPDAPKSLRGLEYLAGHSMKELMKAEETATFWALVDVSKRPTTKIVLPQVDARTVGALLYMLMVQTSIAGEMLGINTYNQPGVEAGKQATMALMGKEGALDPSKKGLPANLTTYARVRDAVDDFLVRVKG